MSTVSPAAVPDPVGAGRPLRLSRLSDDLLARYAARGSDRAFAALYERYYQPLYGYCRSIVRHDADAQDALQSTFTSALTALRRDGRNAPLRPWLYRIAHNESISVLRRRRRDVQQDAVPEPIALGSSAEEEAASRARWRRLVDDLAELPERQRGALLLRELAGLSHEDIAVALGLTVGAAKQAIFEARQGLAEVEEGRAMSCEEVRQRVSEGDRRVLRGRRVRSHLRECAACEAFAVASPARRSELRAYAPALPAAAAATVLSRVLSAGAPHAGASAAAGSAATAGVISKAAGTAVVWKAVAGAAIIATAAAGVTGLTHVLRRAHPNVRAAPQAKSHVATAAARHQSTHHHAAAAHAAVRPAGHLKSHRTTSARADHLAATPGGAAAVPLAASTPGHHAGLGAGRSPGSASRGQSGARTRPTAHSHTLSSGRVHRRALGSRHRRSGSAIGHHTPKTTSATKLHLVGGTVTAPVGGSAGPSGTAILAPKTTSGATAH